MALRRAAHLQRHAARRRMSGPGGLRLTASVAVAAESVKLGVGLCLRCRRPIQLSFVQGAPVLHVADVEATAVFYRDVLGFAWTSATKHTPLSGAITPRFTLFEAMRARRAFTCSKWVKDVDAYFREVVDRGAHVATEQQIKPYGIREFGLRDINGVRIVFGQDIDHD